jgi:peptide/nickel transport system substrate-binding protein
VPELVKIAEKIKENWIAVGVETEIKIFESGDLNQNVIRPRNFDALLFGIIVDDESDLYSFWHSSQRIDPGLNITGYANIEADGLLKKMLENSDVEVAKDLLSKFQKEIENDIPAVFLYSPEFLYVIPENIMGVKIKTISSPSDRFVNIHKWYTQKDKVSKIFINN